MFELSDSEISNFASSLLLYELIISEKSNSNDLSFNDKEYLVKKYLPKYIAYIDSIKSYIDENNKRC